MIQFKKYMIIAASAVLALAGCTKTEEVRIADLYRKAYITTEIYPQNGGLYNVVTVNHAPELVLEDNKLVFKDGGEEITYGGIKSYKVYFRTNYSVDADLKGNLVVPENAEEYLEEGYQLLPAEAYSISTASSTIKAGKKDGEPFVVEFNEKFNDLENGNYILPVVCELEGNAVELSATQNKVVFKLTRGYKNEADGARKERILYSGVDFTFEEATEGAFYDAPYSVASLFNDDISDECFANVQYADVNINFNEPVELSRVGLSLRDSSYGGAYYWFSWDDENGGYGDVGDNFFSHQDSDDIIWFNISDDYLTPGQKLSDLYFMLYYDGYTFNEVYLIAYDE